MSTRRAHRAPPAYPRLTVATALGLGLAGTGCGPEPQFEPVPPPSNETNELVCCADAGVTGPNESEFFGGGAPFELLPDGGVP